MERMPVQSSDIALIGYDEKNSLLEVTFRAGGVYQYEKVPSRVHREFLQSGSHGSYFREHIREQYAYKKVSG